jgi:hypothetical protein
MIGQAIQQMQQNRDQYLQNMGLVLPMDQAMR